jgi:hypothetical protein
VKAGAGAREVLVLQKLLPFVEAVSGAQKKIAVRKITVLPSVRTFAADGTGDWARSAISTAEQLRAATGIDLGAVARRLAAPTPSKPEGA